MKFEVDDIVVAKNTIVESATGDHPAFLLCMKGQKLKVIRLLPKEEFPVYGKDSYEVQDINGDYGKFFIDEIETEASK